MKKLLILLILGLLTAEVFASDNGEKKDGLKHFAVDLGLGICFTNYGNLDPDICFHIGADYVFDEDLSMVGFRYHKFNWNSETTTNIFGTIIKIKQNLDLNSYFLYYRLPLGKFTLALGPGVLDDGKMSYFAPAATIGYLNNISDWWGFEIAASTFYLEKFSELYIYLYGGVRVYF